jgi:hypothetical protein
VAAIEATSIEATSSDATSSDATSSDETSREGRRAGEGHNPLTSLTVYFFSSQLILIG